MTASENCQFTHCSKCNRVKSRKYFRNTKVGNLVIFTRVGTCFFLGAFMLWNVSYTVYTVVYDISALAFSNEWMSPDG